MTPLARLQRGFQQHILEGNSGFERQVACTARVSARRRLEIYSSAYRARIVQALQDDYPGVCALVGEASFQRIAGAYVDANPSPFFNLRWYGGDLAAFARSLSRRRGAVLAEMAQFEWQLGLAFDAANAACVTVEDIAQLPPDDWPRMRFIRHPSASLISLQYNVPALMSAVKDGTPLPAVRRSRTAVYWLIWRQNLNAHFRSLPADEARALDALMRGADFGEICAELSDSTEPASRAAALLKGWITDGLIARSQSLEG